MAGEKTIELDIAADIGWQDDQGNWLDDFDLDKVSRHMDEKAKEFGVTVALADESGPGGGNPVYAFTGSEENLRKLLHWYTDGNAEDMEFLLHGDEAQ